MGPSGASAAFWREAFLEVGGFDERLFAYFEDVDLTLRIRLAGGSCRLAPRALGTHEHSATLGPGSRRKDYLIGFGRGYLLRKWGVLTPRRLPGVILRELAWCAGQLLMDRNLGAISGRLDGLRSRPEAHPYPQEALTGVTSLPGTVSQAPPPPRQDPPPIRLRAILDANLEERLETRLPAGLPAECETAVFVYGSCFHRRLGVRRL